MSDYDPLETSDTDGREANLMDKLARQVAHAKETAHYCFQALAGINPFACASREAPAALPMTRKRDLVELQKKHSPFGGLNALSCQQAKRVFASPSPIYELQGRDIDPWRMARVRYAAGFRHGDLIHNCFSYQFTSGAFVFEGGAHKLGCSVFPGGTGQTEQQVQAIADLRPDGYVGTPSFLRIVIEKAEETGAEVSSLRKATVSGEALPGMTRDWLRERGIAAALPLATCRPSCQAARRAGAAISGSRAGSAGPTRRPRSRACSSMPSRSLAKEVLASLREVSKSRGEMAFCAPGGLPNDGKVIEDSRVY